MNEKQIDDSQLYKTTLNDVPELKRKVIRNLYFLLSITAIISLVTMVFIFFSDTLMNFIITSKKLKIVVIIGLFLLDFLIVIFLQIKDNSIPIPALIFLLLLIPILNGVIIAILLKPSFQLSVIIVFFSSSCMFLFTSLIGLIPKVDLSEFKYSGIMTIVIGVIITIALNIFFKSIWKEWLFSILFVICFAGLVVANIESCKTEQITIDVSKKLPVLKLSLKIICEVYLIILIVLGEAMLNAEDDSND